MLELHYWPTPNGWSCAIMLEECGLPYRMVPVNIGRGEQFAPEFLALLGPHHKMPLLRDTAPQPQGAPIELDETGAILVYLAERCGRFLPAQGVARLQVLDWLMWQAGSLAAIASQHSHFRLYAPEVVPHAIQRYDRTLRRLYQVLDAQLGRTGEQVAGADFSIADMAIVPWVRLHRAQQIDLDGHPHIMRWYASALARPGVQRGLMLGRDLRPALRSDDARQALFGAGRLMHGPAF
jgi:GST-like protein